MTPRDPSLMSDVDRRREVAALLALGFRRHTQNQLAASLEAMAQCATNTSRTETA